LLRVPASRTARQRAPWDPGVLGHPANGVAWLANRLAPYEELLPAGQVILAGSFTRPVLVQAGDVVHADFGELGAVTCRFRLT